MTNTDNRQPLRDIIHKLEVKNIRSLSLRKLSFYLSLCFGGVVLAVAVFIFAFGSAILNHYGKEKVERAFAEANPGYALRFGGLNYAVGANRLIAQSVTLGSTNFTFKVGRVSLTGVSWLRLLWGKASLADVFTKAGLDATNLALEFSQAHYELRCARLRASVPGSELIAEGIELKLLIEDGAFLAAKTFRTTRFHVVVPELKVLGLAYGELLRGKSYQAKSVHFSSPTFDALVSRDKIPEPFVKSPLMVHEALASIRKPLQVDSLSITDGQVKYSERMAVGADPGVLTFGGVSMSVEGITNRSEANAVIQLKAQGDIMNAGTLKVLMSIPITPQNFFLHYSGSLSAIDLTRLNAFLDIAERTRIESGKVQEVSYEIDVAAGKASGRVLANYKDFKISVLHKQIGNEKGEVNRIASFLAKVFKIRKSNTPRKSHTMNEGKVNYKRRPEDTFVQFAWFALRSGVLDVISR